MMRWEGRELTVDDPSALPGMGRLSGMVRTVRTPEFAGITFHEVLCRTALNRVPAASPMPFGWTLNAYRGCSHGCVYCFARQTHTYLDLDAGRDFDTQIVVKTNVAEVLRRELAGPRWSREHVAMGTNTDPYQRAEGRYSLMPGIISALADSGTPFSILTKGTVLARDLPLLAAAGATVPVGIGVSLALLDADLQASLEPGTPTPKARLDLVRRVRSAGLPCGVFIAPVLPYLTDSVEQLTALVGELAEAGVTGISATGLHLRPGAREWFFDWLGRARPDLVPRYRTLYARGSTLPVQVRRELTGRVRQICDQFGIGSYGDGIRKGDIRDGDIRDGDIRDGDIRDGDIARQPREVSSSFPDGSLPRARPSNMRSVRIVEPPERQQTLW